MIDVKHILLVAFFIFAIGMNGCNDRDTTLEINTTDTILPEISSEQKSVKSKVRVAQLKAITPALKNINDNYESSYIVNANNNLTSQIVNKKTDDNITATILEDISSQHSNHNSTITVAQLQEITPALENINDEYQDSYRSYIASRDSNFSSPATRDEVQSMIDEVNRLVPVSDATLADIATQHNNGSSDITVAKLKTILPALDNIEETNEKWYQGYIEATDTHFSSPATVDEVQSMIDEVNSFNLPDNAILDKNFYKKTHNKFEHRFVYLPVTNSNTGRTWLNNNLGAWYANVGRNIYNPSQQATNANDNYAKGSLFQWGRKADGHELVTRWWGNGTIDQLATTTTKSDNPTDGKFIAVNSDWRVHPNDDLWKGINAPNNPCPAHYRVPTKKELDVEAQTWNSLTADGSMSSRLKIPGPGWLNSNGYGMFYPGGAPRIWDTTPGVAWRPHETHSLQRTNGLPLRCIKEQTPAEERSASVLLEIGDEHRNHKSTVTIAQLRAITPALNHINNSYENTYRSYIEGDTHFSSPATRDEVQQMITEVQNLNLPTNAIVDRSFFKKTNGKFEHRFVYLPVTNPKTGRTWLNNNLGADYANKNGYKYNPFRQANTSDDYRAYGSLFQWGRKADGHELINWTDNRHGTKKYGHTSTKSNEPDNSLYIIGSNDWRVTADDTLWASESSKNNVCPVGYRLPLDPNGANDGANEWYQETQTWSSKNPSGAINSVLKLPMSGFSYHLSNDDIVKIGNEASYWFGTAHRNRAEAKSLDFYPNNAYSNANSVKTFGFNVRCIKEQTPAEKKTFSTLVQIGREHNSAKSTITIAQLKAITPALENINDKYESNYQHYIVSTSTHFSSPATREEVQSMIDAVNLNPAYKLSSYDTDGKAYSITLSSDGTKAYIADYTNGLVIVDISDPAHPTKLGLYNTTSKSLGVVLSSDGTKAYIANYMNGLVIVDISDPTHPTKLGSYETAGLSYGVALSSDGTKAYVADAYEGLVIVDISDPTHPIKLGSYDTAGLAEGVTLSSDGAKAYIADYYNGLVIIDISDPHNPTKLGSYDTAGYLQGVTLSSDGTKAYVADDENGLVIVNISDPYNPTKLGSFDIDRYTWSVTLSNDGTKAYVADGAHGLVIVDISNSTHPTKLSSSDTAGFARHVTLSSDGTKAYVADGSDGLVIVDGIE